MKNVAVLGCTLNLPSTVASIATPPSTTVTCDNKGVYAGNLTINIAGYGTVTAGASGITDNNGIGSGVLAGSSVNVSVDGNPVVLEGDSATITVSGTSTSGTTVTPVTENVTVKIVSAGQVSVQAD